jgi:hypothetical protein
VIAALTIIAAIIFMAPFAYSFWPFPIDFLFFVAWLIVFCVLETVSRPSLIPLSGMDLRKITADAGF